MAFNSGLGYDGISQGASERDMSHIFGIRYNETTHILCIILQCKVLSRGAVINLQDPEPKCTHQLDLASLVSMELPQVWHRHAECNDVCKGVEGAKDNIAQVQPNAIALDSYVPGCSNWSTLKHDKQGLRHSAKRNKAPHSPGNDSKPLAWKYAEVQKQDRDLDCCDRGRHEHLGCKHQL